MESFSSAELAFQAEDTVITIVPKQGLAPLEMAGWRSPALKAMRRAEVPLWFAVLLKRQERCAIVWPDWLSLPQIKAFSETEREDQGSFAQLPWFWQPISTILLKEASNDYEFNIEELKQLLQELRELRLVKTRAGVLLTNESHLKMTGLGAMELNEVRSVIGKTMQTLQKIKEE